MSKKNFCIGYLERTNPAFQHWFQDGAERALRNKAGRRPARRRNDVAYWHEPDHQ
jgi:hypothetical protein